MIAFTLVLLAGIGVFVWAILPSSGVVEPLEGGAVAEPATSQDASLEVDTSADIELGSEWGAERFFSAFIQANLGPNGVDSLNTIRLSGVIHHADSAQEFVIYKKQPDRARMNQTLANGVKVAFGVHGSTVWRQLQAPNGERQTNLLKGAKAASYRSMGPFFSPFIRYALDYGANDPNFKIVDDAAEDGDLIQIEFTNPYDGMLSRVSIDPETLLVQRREDPGRGSASNLIVYGDYESVQGVQMPKTQKTFWDGELISSIEIDQVAFNSGIVSNIFDLPREAE